MEFVEKIMGVSDLSLTTPFMSLTAKGLPKASRLLICSTV